MAHTKPTTATVHPRCFSGAGSISRACIRARPTCSPWTGSLKVPHPYGRTISGPTAGEGVLVAVASGFQNRGYTVGLKAGGKGDITETHRLWTCSKFSADCPSPLVYQGKLFFIRDDGMASCLVLKTGETLLQERLFSAN